MNKKMMIIIAAVVVVLAGGGGAAYFLMRGDAAEAATEAAEKPDDSLGMIELEQFLTNINDPRGERHARLQVKLAVSPKTAVEEIKADELTMARARDQVLTLLTAKTFNELRDPAGKEAFRKEIHAKLAPLIKGGEIREVLFADFVVQ